MEDVDAELKDLEVEGDETSGDVSKLKKTGEYLLKYQISTFIFILQITSTFAIERN